MRPPPWRPQRERPPDPAVFFCGEYHYCKECYAQVSTALVQLELTASVPVSNVPAQLEALLRVAQEINIGIKHLVAHLDKQELSTLTISKEERKS